MQQLEHWSPQRPMERWSSKRRLGQVHWSDKSGTCWQAPNGIQVGAACQLTHLDGAPLVSGTVQDCFLEAGQRCITVRLDHPGCLIERAFAGGEREVLLQAGDAPAQRMTLVRLLFEPRVGRSCVLREVDQAPSPP